MFLHFYFINLNHRISRNFYHLYIDFIRFSLHVVWRVGFQWIGALQYSYTYDLNINLHLTCKRSVFVIVRVSNEKGKVSGWIYTELVISASSLVFSESEVCAICWRFDSATVSYACCLGGYYVYVICGCISEISVWWWWSIYVFCVYLRPSQFYFQDTINNNNYM